MVSRCGGDDTCTSLIRIEIGKNVYGAPQFKATRMLEIFHLKPDIRSDKGRQRLRRLQWGSAYGLPDSPCGCIDSFQCDTVHWPLSLSCHNMPA